MFEEQQVGCSVASVFIDGMTRSSGLCLYMMSCSCAGVMILTYVWRRAQETGLVLLSVETMSFATNALSYILELKSSVYMEPGSLNVLRKRCKILGTLVKFERSLISNNPSCTRLLTYDMRKVSRSFSSNLSLILKIHGHFKWSQNKRVKVFTTRTSLGSEMKMDMSWFRRKRIRLGWHGKPSLPAQNVTTIYVVAIYF